jgi:6-phosphofructokinase 1
MKKPSFARSYCIVVVAEGAKPIGGELSIRGKARGQEVQLGGIGEQVARELGELTNKETRAAVLGHIVRGGSPSSTDRNLGLALGAAAVRALLAGESGVMMAIDPPDIVSVPLEKAVSRMKTVPLDGWAVTTARALDITFGDGRALHTIAPQRA